MGLPPTLAMMNAGVAIGLSLDTMAASDNSDMFNAMRITMGIERARAGDGKVYQPMQALAQATSEAAATIGLGEVTGRLRKGLRADVILLRATDLNMAPLNVPDGQVVLAGQPSQRRHGLHRRHAAQARRAARRPRPGRADPRRRGGDGGPARPDRRAARLGPSA